MCRLKENTLSTKYFVQNTFLLCAHILYRLSEVHFMYFYYIGNLQPHEDFSTCYQKQGFSQCHIFNHANSLTSREIN